MDLNAFNINLGATEAIALDAKSEISAAYEYDTTLALESIIKEYASTGESQTLSFRSLVSWIKVGERATHYIHPYPLNYYLK